MFQEESPMTVSK